MNSEEIFFTPHITVACVVQAENKFLMVEEKIDGKITLNQPAGHLEAGESILVAAQRELWEETGLKLVPQSLIKVFQWVAADKTPFIRFTFCLDLLKIAPTAPNDTDIERCVWLAYDEIVNAENLRSPLVRESLIAYKENERYPTSIFTTFGQAD